MTRRTNPYDWLDDSAPDGVFIGGGEEGLSLLGLPQGIAPKARNAAYDQRDAARRSDAVRATLLGLVTALVEASADGQARQIRLDHLAGDERDLLLDVLGEGEASCTMAQPDGTTLQAMETTFPGLWMVRTERGEITAEVADVPRNARETVAAMAARAMPLEFIVPPDGTMNVMGVLAEIRHVAGLWKPGQANHVLNFTLLPMTEADADFLARMLGQGPVHFASGGYGAARILATAFHRVWAVQYLNSMGAVILDTVEIGDVPTAACAAKEDFEDSAIRLRHILQGELQ